MVKKFVNENFFTGMFTIVKVIAASELFRDSLNVNPTTVKKFIVWSSNLEFNRPPVKIVKAGRCQRREEPFLQCPHSKRYAIHCTLSTYYFTCIQQTKLSLRAEAQV
jgi:hypothetical protein